MNYFVKIIPLNGRYAKAELVSKLNACGISEAEYFPGGWLDNSMSNVFPHLRFQDEEDALMYALKFGGEVLNEPPALTFLKVR